MPRTVIGGIAFQRATGDMAVSVGHTSLLPDSTVYKTANDTR